jgi:hypothetical protein
MVSSLVGAVRPSRPTAPTREATLKALAAVSLVGALLFLLAAGCGEESAAGSSRRLG